VENPGPALALLDLSSIPHALLALDALVKEATVTVLARGTVQPGRYLILFGGDTEAVTRSRNKAQLAVPGAIRDEVLLPYADERIAPAVLDGRPRFPHPGDALGAIQVSSPPTLLLALDRALKGAYVELVQVRVAEGLGGGAIALVWGESYDVEAALELAEEAAGRGLADGLSTMIIRNADPEVVTALSGGTNFYQEWRG
jgi:microcompartment protein CcmL/EutN